MKAHWLEDRVPDADDRIGVLADEEDHRWVCTEVREIEWSGEERVDIQGSKLVDMMVPADRVLFWDSQDDAVKLPAGLFKELSVPGSFYTTTFNYLGKGQDPV